MLCPTLSVPILHNSEMSGILIENQQHMLKREKYFECLFWNVSLTAFLGNWWLV